jgi:hypothetical protein
MRFSFSLKNFQKTRPIRPLSYLSMAYLQTNRKTIRPICPVADRCPDRSTACITATSKGVGHMTSPGVHFAVLVVTKDKPTERVLARALRPFGPRTVRPKWNWYALGGRFSGVLHPLDVADTVTGGLEYPDDELSQATDPRHKTGSGIAALIRRNLECIELAPGVVVWDGRWHETKNFTWELGLGGRVRCHSGWVMLILQLQFSGAMKVSPSRTDGKRSSTSF